MKPGKPAPTVSRHWGAGPGTAAMAPERATFGSGRLASRPRLAEARASANSTEWLLREQQFSPYEARACCPDPSALAGDACTS